MANKRFFAGMLSVLTLLSAIPFPVPVYAANTTTTNLTVSSATLGSDLVVVIPDNVNLTKNGEVFSGTGKVYAEGVTTPTKMITVSTDEIVTYKNQSKDSITVDASVTFGTNGVATWDATTLKDNLSISAEADKIGFNITSTVQLSDIDYIGTYKTNILFNIALDNNVNAASVFMAYDYTNTPTTYTDNKSVPYEIYEVDGQVAELTEWGTDYDDLASRHDYVVEVDSANVVIPTQVEGNDVVNVQFDSFFANEDIATSISTVEVPASVEGVVLSEDDYLQSGSTTVITCENLRRMTTVEKNIPDNAKIRFKFINENGDVDYVEFFTYNSMTDTRAVTGLSDYGIQYLTDNYEPTDTVAITMPSTHPSGQPVVTMDFGNFGNANAVADELPFVSLSFPDTYTSITGEWNGWYEGTNEFLATKLVALDFDGIEEIRNDAFRYCTYSALKSITIPASIQKIGSYAFLGCTNVETVTFEDGVGNIDIGGWSFYSAKEVYLPSTMTKYDSTGGFNSSFKNTPNIVYWNTSINNVSSAATELECPVQFTDALGTINGATLSCNSYDADTQTAYFTSESPSTVQYAEDNIYKHIVLTNAVTIPSRAFRYTNADITITDASTITSIGSLAFENKTLIGDIVLGSCTLEYAAFYGATINSLDIRNATSIGEKILGTANVNTLYAKDTQIDGRYDALGQYDTPTVTNLYIDYSGATLDSGISITIAGDVHFSGTEAEYISFVGSSSFDFLGTIYYGDGTSSKSPYVVDKENVTAKVAEFDGQGKSKIFDITALSAINLLAGKTVDGLVTTSTQFAQDGSSRDKLTSGVVYIEYIDGDTLGQPYDGFYNTDFGTIYFTGTEEQWDSFATSTEAIEYKTNGKVVFNASLPDSADTITVKFVTSIPE